MLVRAYFVLGGEPGVVGLVPVLRTVPETTGVARAAMTALLAGPTLAEDGERTITSAIPDGTTLLGVTIKNGVATVDLSSEFDSGGGTASMQYRLAQVVYTLTQFSTVRSVVFQIDGTTVTVFGGEGIVLDGPQARKDYYDELPSIFVDRPAYGAALGNVGPVAGNANVFEATFRIAILDASGKVLMDDHVTASCGSGCRGGFDLLVGYTISKAQWGTLRVYDPSEIDGTPEDIRDYPVWLTPHK
jgi:germination protein M